MFLEPEAKPIQQYATAAVWFRRDLRDFDHAALYYALKHAAQVFCVFVFDTDILNQLPNKNDRRVEFIWESVSELKTVLQAQGGDLIVLHGSAEVEIPKLAQQHHIQAVFTNHDYEPSAIARDHRVQQQLFTQNVQFHTFKDHVIFEKNEVLTQTNKPYSVFTPYKNAWLKKCNDFYLKPYPVDTYIAHLAKTNPQAMPSLACLGFMRTNLSQLRLPTGMSGGKVLLEDFMQRIGTYKEARDYPAIKGVSYLSVHLRFGTVSIRNCARQAATLMDIGSQGIGSQTWLNELIWRDFYVQILHHHPQVASGHTFKAEFESIGFSNNPAYFKAWCEGNTGYPLVDAAMRQLNTTGYMHNRLRMVVASFLVKDLLVDWRWGERYFAQHLTDFDLSANNGGWQWAASTGCDAQPWFRIFNPITQSERFDPQGKFIRKYVPELSHCHDKEIHAPWLMSSTRQSAIQTVIGQTYPFPIIDHATQRALALALYKTP